MMNSVVRSPDFQRWIICLGVAFAGLFVWGSTYQTARTPLVLWHYWGLALAGWGATCFVLTHWQPFKQAAPVSLAGCLIAFAWLPFDTYETVEHDIGQFGELIRRVDLHRRLGGVPLKRSVYARNEIGDLAWVGKGPLSSSGRPHGRWEIIYFDGRRSEQLWLWAGDEVTAERWHALDESPLL